MNADGVKRSKKSLELENELKRLLDLLDHFQRQIEETDNDPTTNEELGRDLNSLLSDLDAFQAKLEEADDDDMLVLQGLLVELQDKMMKSDEKETNLSKKGNGRVRGETPEKHLELYRRYKARTGLAGYDSPQGLILKNVVARKKQETRPIISFISSLFGSDEYELEDITLAPRCSDDDLEDSGVLRALRLSNAMLKETVCKLESIIAQMEKAFKQEIKTYQKVIVQLQAENISLHYKLEQALLNQDPAMSRQPTKPVDSPSLRASFRHL